MNEVKGKPIYVIEESKRQINDLEKQSIFFKIEPRLKKEEKKKLVEAISELGRKDISAIELYDSPIKMGKEDYDAAIVSLNPDEQNKKRILETLVNIPELSRDFYIKQEILACTTWYTTSSGKLNL